jgi:hypothetical protein
MVFDSRHRVKEVMKDALCDRATFDGRNGDGSAGSRREISSRENRAMAKISPLREPTRSQEVSAKKRRQLAPVEMTVSVVGRH